MVDGIIGHITQEVSNGFNPRANISTSNAITDYNFMDVLRDKFAEVTDRLSAVPGMPGVFSAQSPLESQMIKPSNSTTDTIA